MITSPPSVVQIVTVRIEFKMNAHLQTLTNAITDLQKGHVQTKKGRSDCLMALKRSIEGRHKFWETAGHGAGAAYIEEVRTGGPPLSYPPHFLLILSSAQDIQFNLKLVEFISILLGRLRDLEEQNDLCAFLDDLTPLSSRSSTPPTPAT